MNDEVIYCDLINNMTHSYEKEEVILCQICNVSKGLRIRNDNWKSELIVTRKENITF